MIVFIMHFWNFASRKTRFLLTKNDTKNHLFFAFSAIFRDFWKIEKNSQVQIFWRILQGVPCKLQADHGQIKTTSRGASILSNTSLKVCNACKSLKMFLFKIEKNKKFQNQSKNKFKNSKKKRPPKNWLRLVDVQSFDI